MQMKLASAQAVLKGLAVKDFEAIEVEVTPGGE